MNPDAPFFEPCSDDRPDVSVVIPYYASPATLIAAIASVLEQEGVAVEVIVIDDASPVPPRDLPAAAGSRLRLARNKTNVGQGASRNRGLFLARGRYVCFLDHDDLYAPGFFARAVPLLDSRPQLAGVVTGIEFFDCHRPVSAAHYEALVRIFPSNLMLRTEIALAVGGFPEDAAFRGEAAGEDAEFRKALSPFLFHYLPAPYLRYRVRRGSHFDLFMDSMRLVGGRLAATAFAREHFDGSLERASARYQESAGRRLAWMGSAWIGAAPADQLRLAGADRWRGLEAALGPVGGTAGPDEGQALALWAERGRGLGDVLVIGPRPGRSLGWLLAGCRESGRGRVSFFDRLEPAERRILFERLGSADLLAGLDAIEDGREPEGPGRPFRLFLLDGAWSYEQAKADLDAWLGQVETVGAVGFLGVGVDQALTRLYRDTLDANLAVREVQAVGSLRFLAAR